MNPHVHQHGRGRDVRSLRRRAAKSVTKTVAAGVEAYDRIRHLPRLIPIAPDRLADASAETRGQIVARLARALRAERNRGRAGHWTYDLNRHIGLRQAYEAERRLLATAARQAGTPKQSAAGTAADAISGTNG